jgi:hypothetical protein
MMLSHTEIRHWTYVHNVGRKFPYSRRVGCCCYYYYYYYYYYYTSSHYYYETNLFSFFFECLSTHCKHAFRFSLKLQSFTAHGARSWMHAQLYHISSRYIKDVRPAVQQVLALRYVLFHSLLYLRVESVRLCKLELLRSNKTRIPDCCSSCTIRTEGNLAHLPLETCKFKVTNFTCI